MLSVGRRQRFIVNRRSPVACCVFLVSVSGCGGDAPQPVTPAAASVKAPRSKADGKAAFGLPRSWPKSRLLPDIDPQKRADLESAEGTLRLLGRMRVRTKRDGSIERAPDLLPVGRVASIRLPGRLGGGFVFVSATGRGTELWRAPSWLDPLVPLTTVGPAADMDKPLVAGFDRLYLRLRSGELLALDPQTGTPTDFGALPVAPSYGEMLFFDGWRAVVDTDIRGALATFDAGQTWRAIPLASRLRSLSASEREPQEQAGAIIGVDGGYYILSPAGDLAYFDGALPNATTPPPPISFATPPGAARPTPSVLTPIDDEPNARPGPLGRRPLRVALERGYPDSDKTAVVAHAGALVKVSLQSGTVVEAIEDAYPEPHAACQGIALAGGGNPSSEIGFVCGAPGGGTTVYALDGRAMRPVLRFAEPRVVLESGQGALVVRGPCTEEAAPAGVRPFCVRALDGTTREVRVRGEVGAERVIALADGRVVILVPPRPGTQGQLSILEGSKSKHVPLRVPDGAPREVETGLWLDGMQQTGSDEIGGWIEAGGPSFGVRVKLDGVLAVGPVVNEPNGVVVSGRFGLAVGNDGKLLESTDMGKSWAEVVLPSVPEADNTVISRRCGPVGCALPGWLRVGWGDPQLKDDLREVAQPEAPKLNSFKLSGQPLTLVCGGARRLGEGKKKQAPARETQGEAPLGWTAFQGVAPPPLAKDEVGFDSGDRFGAWPFHTYAWGKKDSDWTRTGRFVVRFEDEFSLDPVRSSAPSASPWNGEEAVRDMFGAGTFGSTWGAFRDPAGRSSLISICRVRACNVFAVEAGQPVLQLRGPDLAGPVKPLPQTAVQVGPVWFYLGDEGVPDRVGVYRADLGRVRRIASLPRPLGRSSPALPPRLVRRASSGGLGLLFTTKEGPFDRRGTRWVIPINTETGALGEPRSLGRPDLGDMRVTAPCAGEDGWLVELSSSDVTADASTEAGRLMLESFEVRARVDAGYACIEAASALITQPVDGKQPKGKGGGSQPGAGLLPLFATDRTSGDRTELACRLSNKP